MEVRFEVSPRDVMMESARSDKKCDCCSAKIEEGDRFIWVNRQGCIDQIPRDICQKCWHGGGREEEVRSLIDAQKGDEETWLVKFCRFGSQKRSTSASNGAAKTKD
jgi:hypothetical protein